MAVRAVAGWLEPSDERLPGGPWPYWRLRRSRLGIACSHDFGDPGAGVFGVRSSHFTAHIAIEIDATGAFDQALQIHHPANVEPHHDTTFPGD